MKAIADFELAIQMTPQHRQAWYGLVLTRVYLAEALQVRGEPPNEEVSRALRDCEKALKLAPDNWQVLSTRGFLLDAAGDPEGALRDYAEAVRILGNTPGWLKGMIDQSEKKLNPR